MRGDNIIPRVYNGVPVYTPERDKAIDINVSGNRK